MNLTEAANRYMNESDVIDINSIDIDVEKDEDYDDRGQMYRWYVNVDGDTKYNGTVFFPEDDMEHDAPREIDWMDEDVPDNWEDIEDEIYKAISNLD